MNSDASYLDSHGESMPGWKTGESSDSDVPELPTKANSFRLDLSESASPGCSSWSSNPNSKPYNNSHHTSYSSKPRTSPKYNSMSQNHRKANAHSGIYQNNSSSHYNTHSSSSPAKPKTQFNADDESYSNRSHYISMLLLVLAGLFFSVLAFVYMNMWTMVTDESAYPMIQKGDPPPTEVMTFIKNLSDKLSTRAGHHFCSDPTTDPVVSMEDFNTYAKEGKAGDTEAALNTEDALNKIHEHPEWEIRLLDRNKVRLEAGDMLQVADVMFLVSGTPDMDLWCRLCRATSKVFYVLLVGAAGLLLCCLVLVLLKYRWRRQKAQVKELYALVEQIVNVVRSHQETYQKAREDGDTEMVAYLAIPHVRDMLIPARQRRQKKQLWDKAVKFISANESRVREEIQIIANEEYCVWRWLQQSCTNGRKVWQGQAFGENAKSNVNMPSYSPTPCLKIRNMFDSEVEYGEDWHVTVQDAILEKCGLDHNIVHIAVDKASKEGCVYVKCACPDAAGKVYKSLHGSYFDGVLVTVKYIRLERYHERFPEAHTVDVALCPSNNEKRSLSQLHHASIIESS